MAGHSKWANIRHRKGAQDAKRGKIFTKIQKEISVAVKVAGPDSDSNPRLRSAIQLARQNNMPKDNIERAIKKASGEDAENFIETTFEGYGPDGIAVFVECATDNNTRTVSNVRSYFNKNNGSLGKDGCLQFVFEQKAVFILPKKNYDEDEFTLELIDMGAEDVDVDEEYFTVIGQMQDWSKIQKELEKKEVEISESSLQRIPTSYKTLSEENLQLFERLVKTLEDDDDVQKVYHNLKMSLE